jgi:hypothetical protein
MKNLKTVIGIALACIMLTGCGNDDYSSGNSNVIQENNYRNPGQLAGPNAVNLRTAGNYVILAKAAISTVAPSVITGDMGVSPAAASYITGFSLVADASNTFSTSSQVTGKLFAADYTSPTPSNLTTAVSDMETAYTDAAGRPNPDFTELASGDISGLTLQPGLYKWGTGLLISSDVYFNGTSEDVIILQIAQGITIASGMKIILTGGIQAKNIFFAVGDVVTVGTGAHIEGIILSQTMISLQTGASINGRLLAQTAVTLDQATVTKP